MKKILVVDGNSIINRAYYGVRPLTTKSGKSTHAVYGMINIIQRQISAIKPDYAAVAFDLKHPTFRHELYTEYKAGRSPTPEDLKSQFPDAKDCLHFMGLHILELPGYEADDIQGTVAKMAHGSPDTVSFVLSGDRDLLQLIDDKVTVLLATTGDTKEMTPETFKEEYGIDPSSFVDMKALMGDSSDNIPGVAGIGKKTAATLIQNFKTLDGIYENIESPLISKGVREKLIKDKDNAYLSRTLAKINTEAPIGKELSELAISETDRGALYTKFLELELNSLIAKFGLSAEDVRRARKNEAGAEGSANGDAQDADGDGTPEQKKKHKAPKKLSEGQLGFDFPEEGESSDFMPFELKNIEKTRHAPLSVQIIGEKIYFTSCGENYYYDGPLYDLRELLCDREIICFDGKALWHALDKAGIPTEGIKFLDLLLYAYAINPGGGSQTAESVIASFTGKVGVGGEASTNFFEEAEKTMREQIERDGLSKILYEIELPLIPILSEIEKNGFKINSREMREYSEALGELADELTASIYAQVGHEFNINSPKQLGTVLFEELGLYCPKKKTKTGYSTDAETLEQIRSDSPIIDDILEYRQVTKLKGTYADALPLVADEFDRIHTDFKQALTATGRLSSADPNLQNIPIKTKMGRQMRRSFIAEDGYTLVDADYSQIELRLLAHISDDEAMKEAFRENQDIHKKTASAVFGIPEDEVNEQMRKRAKAVNFGIVYGIGGFSLSKDLGISVAEASGYIKNYLMSYPGIEAYLESVVKAATEQGYTATVFGRRRYIPELNAQNGNLRAFGKRVAMNAPIQGTAADIMKLAMIKVYNRLKEDELDARIVMQVHDELVIEARLDQAEKVKTVVREEMEGVASLSIPLTVDVTSGANWLEQE